MCCTAPNRNSAALANITDARRVFIIQLLATPSARGCARKQLLSTDMRRRRNASSTPATAVALRARREASGGGVAAIRNRIPISSPARNPYETTSALLLATIESDANG